MIVFFGKLWRNKRGNALAIAAACLPLFVGAAGLATDTIQWTLWKRQLQRAADSAAIAGVYDRVAKSGATTNTDADGHARSRFEPPLVLRPHGREPFLQWKVRNRNTGRHAIPEGPSQGHDRYSAALGIQFHVHEFAADYHGDVDRGCGSGAVEMPASMRRARARPTPELPISGNAGIEAPDCVMYCEPVQRELGLRKGQLLCGGRSGGCGRRDPAIEQLARAGLSALFAGVGRSLREDRSVSVRYELRYQDGGAGR